MRAREAAVSAVSDAAKKADKADAEDDDRAVEPKIDRKSLGARAVHGL